MEHNICVKAYTILTLYGFESLDSQEHWGGKKKEILRHFEPRKFGNFCHRNFGSFCQTAHRSFRKNE